LAGEGITGFMVSMKRISDKPYRIEFDKVPLKEVAIAAKPMPPEYFNSEGNFVSPAFLDYMTPLAGDLPEFVKLENIFVRK
jgi:6-phosphofructokinase 1